ncbi:MAG: hypothetical protein HZA90_03945 [Verrucomicrobia bacterium]|nr:hypothetical protein [Verrucomicrobiota bacterium]
MIVISAEPSVRPLTLQSIRHVIGSLIVIVLAAVVRVPRLPEFRVDAAWVDPEAAP